ncbi:nuclear transport factor 2 family protein [Burkholderia sp. Ac-20353]|uniref:nuclear transport factor 2 family protein n=1 Tax=Burkholderia sp. Ac-20353 TaxID=2703894 RepID=UPI00197B9153|nr:nuclear transport factor 2 family protein [Burkholderia sp. Ac-20353]MBN3789125.1 nuclear transport factor 2 family protein [Burkholderia sp. Ac-20353]
MEIRSMTDEQRKALALEYLKRLDRGENILDLFDEHAEVYFPKWGLARGKQEIEKLFSDLMTIIDGVLHETSYLNVIQQGDLVCVEGLSSGKLKNGAQWRAGTTHAGRWCDVFEIRDFRIHRCHIYLDPDYAGADTGRYPWLEADQDRRY